MSEAPAQKPDPTPAEFVEWITPRQAVALLKPHVGGETNARHLIRDALLVGKVQAAAEDVYWMRGTSQHERHFLRIAPIWWRDRNLNIPDGFWSSGRIDLSVVIDPVNISRRTYQLFNTRFWEAEVQSLAPHAFPPEPSAVDLAADKFLGALEAAKKTLERRATTSFAKAAQLTEKVTHAELREWLSVFGPRNRGQPFHFFMANARVAFPNRRVTQQPLRDVIAELKLGLTPGNPKITRKNREIGDGK